MKPERTVSQAAVLLLLTGFAHAQNLPDFSGKWTVAPTPGSAGTSMGSAPPTLSALGTMGSGWGTEIVMTQDANALNVEYTYFHPREIQPPFRFKYLLDNSPSKNTVNLGRGPQEQTAKAHWDGNTLVITTTHRFINPLTSEAMTSETRQALSLTSPTSLLIETTRSGVMGGKASTTTTNYKKN